MTRVILHSFESFLIIFDDFYLDFFLLFNYYALTCALKLEHHSVLDILTLQIKLLPIRKLNNVKLTDHKEDLHGYLGHPDTSNTELLDNTEVICQTEIYEKVAE